MFVLYINTNSDSDVLLNKSMKTCDNDIVYTCICPGEWTKVS